MKKHSSVGLEVVSMDIMSMRSMVLSDAFFASINNLEADLALLYQWLPQNIAQTVFTTQQADVILYLVPTRPIKFQTGVEVDMRLFIKETLFELFGRQWKLKRTSTAGYYSVF